LTFQGFPFENHPRPFTLRCPLRSFLVFNPPLAPFVMMWTLPHPSSFTFPFGRFRGNPCPPRVPLICTYIHVGPDPPPTRCSLFLDPQPVPERSTARVSYPPPEAKGAQPSLFFLLFPRPGEYDPCFCFSLPPLLMFFLPFGEVGFFFFFNNPPLVPPMSTCWCDLEPRALKLSPLFRLFVMRKGVVFY